MSGSKHGGNPDISGLKEEFFKFCHLLYERGLVSGAGGNLSVRFGEKVYITPSGYSLRDIGHGNMVTVDRSGKVLAGGRPTMEVDMHLGILNAMPDVNVVCHAHGTYIIAATELMDPGPVTLPPLTPGFIYCAYPLAMIPFMIPGTEELSKAVIEHFAQSASRALLLKNHGLVTVGRDFREALNIAEEVDEASRIWLLTNCRARGVAIEDVEKIKKF